MVENINFSLYVVLYVEYGPLPGANARRKGAGRSSSVSAGLSALPTPAVIAYAKPTVVLLGQHWARARSRGGLTGLSRSDCVSSALQSTVIHKQRAPPSGLRPRLRQPVCTTC